MLLHYLVKFENSQQPPNHYSYTGKINLFYKKLSKVNKVQNMLISM